VVRYKLGDWEKRAKSGLRLVATSDSAELVTLVKEARSTSEDEYLYLEARPLAPGL